MFREKKLLSSIYYVPQSSAQSRDRAAEGDHVLRREDRILGEPAEGSPQRCQRLPRGLSVSSRQPGKTSGMVKGTGRGDGREKEYSRGGGEQAVLEDRNLLRTKEQEQSAGSRPRWDLIMSHH